MRGNGGLAFGMAPIHNADAEILVLGALIVHVEARARIGDLDPECFFNLQRRRAFEVISARITAGEHVDPVTMKAVFATDPDLGPEVLAEAVDHATTPINAGEYARELRRLWQLRHLDFLADDLKTFARQSEPGEDPPEYVARKLRELPGNGTAAPEGWSDCVRSIDALGRAYSEPEQFVDGFLTVGLTVVSATPKAGKTWLVHEGAIGVATGDNALGTLPCRRSEVLCIFLEDSERRGILRERTLLGHASGCAGITYAWVGSKWNLDRLARWLDLHPACRVIIVDTAERWKQVQPDAESTGRVYADDYRFWGALQEFAISRSIALILIHHDRKPSGNGGNILDTVSGTRAITGAADHVWLLERNSETGVSTLKVVGRDLDERSVQFSRGIDGRLRAVETPVMDMVARIELRARAKRMRQDGATFGEIAKALGVSKSTAEWWCRDADGK